MFFPIDEGLLSIGKMFFPKAYLNKHIPSELTDQVMAYASLLMSSNKEENALIKQTLEYMDKYSSEMPTS